MNKMLNNMINELDELMKKMDKDNFDKLKNLQNDFQKIKKDRVTINLDLDHGRLKIEAKGNHNSILIALAVLEDKILKETMTPAVYFDFLKEVLKSDEVDLDE